MEFRKSYALKQYEKNRAIALYRVTITFKNGKVKTYRRCIFCMEFKKGICLKVLDRKGYDFNIVKAKYYIKDISIDISGLAWDYQYGKYFYRRLFNEIYY